MLTEFHALSVGDPLHRAVDLLMAGSQQDFPVVDGANPVGVLTRSELVAALGRRGRTCRSARSCAATEHAAEDEPLDDALQRMREAGRLRCRCCAAARWSGCSRSRTSATCCWCAKRCAATPGMSRPDPA